MNSQRSFKVLVVTVLLFLQIIGCSKKSTDFRPDFSTPEKSIKSSIYSSANGLFDVYLESLSEALRSRYGHDKVEQIKKLEMMYELLNDNKKVFDPKKVDISIQQVIYCKDRKAVVVILRQIYEGRINDRDEGALMIYENGLWRLGLMPYPVDSNALAKFKDKNSPEISQQIASYIQQQRKQKRYQVPKGHVEED